MRQTLPVSYVSIWCQKNQVTVTLRTKTDSYQITGKGVSLLVADGAAAPINARQVFRIVNRFPSLHSEDLLPVTPGRPLYLNAQRPGDKAVRPISFDAIADEVERYLSLLSELDLLSFYIAVRAYETGLVGLPQLNRIASTITPADTLGSLLLKQKMCEWEDLLAVCLDLERPGKGRKAGRSGKGTGEFELCGEILVALGKLSRSQLESALRIKRKGSKPLGEILLTMGVCTAGDIEDCLQAQEQMRSPANRGVGLVGDLLVEQGKVTRDDLYEALRLQKAARQPLDALLVSMGAVSPQFVQEFRWRMPDAVDANGCIDEKIFARILLQQNRITEHQLNEAAHLQKRGRQLIGELLVGLKMCSAQEIESALNAQRHLRQSSQRGPDKLGQILVQKRIVQPDVVEEASNMQRLGREQIGATLIGLGACTQMDFADALEIQFSWRESLQTAEDKLGHELVRNGAISQDSLASALDIHARAGKPLGQILVEQGACTPEVVIDTLIQRDERRRAAFLDYLARHMPTPGNRPAKASAPARTGSSTEQKPGLLQKVSDLFKRND